MTTGVIISNTSINSGDTIGFAIVVKENGTAKTPSEVTWTLLNRYYEVVNGREDVSETPGNPTIIGLAPTDTTITSGRNEYMYLIVTSTFLSSVVSSSGGENSGVLTDEAGNPLVDEFGDPLTNEANTNGFQQSVTRQWRFTVKHTN